MIVKFPSKVLLEARLVVDGDSVDVEDWAKEGV